MNATACPSCNAPIAPAVAAAPYCAWCGRSRATPAQRVEPTANAQAAIEDDDDDGPVSDDDQGAPAFSVYSGDLCLAFDPQIGFALIGSHTPRGERPRIRAYDLYNRRVAWESLVGLDGVKDVDDERLAVRGRNVYVGFERSMQVLDLYTGQRKWGAELSDRLTYRGAHGPERGLEILDPFPPGARGAVLAFTTDDVIHSFDRESGQPLWRDRRESLPYGRACVDQSGLVAFDDGHLIDPFQQKPVRRVAGWGGIVGHHGLWRVKTWGWLQREGIVLFDYLANKEVLFEAIDDVESDVPLVAGHGRLFCAVSDEKLFAAPNGKPTLLKEGFEIRALCMAGPTLFVMLEKRHGTGYRRVLGVDPQTLAVRFDLGELTTEPNDDWPRQMCGSDQLAVIVTSRDSDDDHCELWGVLPTGHVIWRTYVGEWRTHCFLGGHVVVHSGSGWTLLRPNDGGIVTAYTR